MPANRWKCSPRWTCFPSAPDWCFRRKCPPSPRIPTRSEARRHRGPGRRLGRGLGFPMPNIPFLLPGKGNGPGWNTSQSKLACSTIGQEPCHTATTKLPLSRLKSAGNKGAGISDDGVKADFRKRTLRILEFREGRVKQLPNHPMAPRSGVATPGSHIRPLANSFCYRRFQAVA